MPYPWNEDDVLVAADLNAAIAGVTATHGQPGPPGPPAVMILTGHGPPTEDAPDGTTYFDLSNGDVWQVGGVAPPVPYHAPAVHFESSIWLETLSLTATDNAFFSASFWQKTESIAQMTVIEGNPSVGAPFVGIKSSGGPSGSSEFYISDHSGDNYLDLTSSAYNKTVWHHFLVSMDAGHVAAAMIATLYINDVLDGGAAKEAFGTAFINGVNGVGFSVSRGAYVGDLADVRIMCGVSLLDGSGLIPTATRRLFIDAGGKPVDPAVATAALGAPSMLFSGNAASFATNQGAGGVFGVPGLPLTDATTSPSD